MLKLAADTVWREGQTGQALLICKGTVTVDAQNIVSQSTLLTAWTEVFSCLLVTEKATEALPASPAKGRETPAPSGAAAVSQATPEKEK